MQDYAQKIKDNGDVITGDMLEDIIADHSEDKQKMIKLYERYKASTEGVPIFERKHPDYDEITTRHVKRIDDKVNNTLNNSFDSDIVDTAAGYFLGHPIMYNYDGDTQSTADEIETFNLRNHVEDADAEWGKMSIICGKGARLAYIDREGKERIKNIDPWQVAFIGDTIHEPDFSIRYYKDAEGKNRAEFYNNTNIYYFVEHDGSYEEESTQPHMFEYNPLFGVSNNKEEQGDAEKVLTLIDAYDRTLSDASNEIEQYRLAYLVFKGIRPDEDTQDNMKHGRVIELLEENDDVSYLTKDINDDLIEHHLDRLEQNILKFAKSVDFTDEQFAGDVSGVALRYKLLALENKCVTKERKFTAALRYQYKVLFSAWSKRHGIKPDDYLKVNMTFQRNLPVNLKEEAEIQQLLMGVLSEETRVSLFTKIDDVQEELERMKKEQDEYSRNLRDLEDDPDNGSQQQGIGES